MSFPSTEVRLIATFKQGLKQAVRDIDGYSWDDVDSITEQKLLLMGIREYDLESEVTIQWYADGDMLPKLDDGIENSHELAIREENDSYPTVQQVAEYYIGTEEESDSLPTEATVTEVIRAETFEWLREYYEQYNGPFQGLYLRNIEIHLHLYQCANACKQESPVNEFPESLIQPLREQTSEMKRELLRYQIFAGLESYVAEFASVAETVLSECARQEITAMNQEERSNYRKLLQHLDTFYYHGLWKQITRLIAVHTVDGPDDYFERAANWGRIEKTKEKFIEVFGEFKETASEYDIEVEINEERLPEVWVTKESITKEEFINWELEQALSRDAVSPVPEDDPIHDLVG